ncbi:hypothetical protein [Paraburkholderia diazotrophica]|uniref:hypothetical protein n=1 Tax=Paraburkholderia diazotrophica TaxID=667676 RepID=UPI00316EFBDB
MAFKDIVVNKKERYSIGTEDISGGHYVAVPVSNSLVDYDEYYEISKEEFNNYLNDENLALEFVEKCRRREQDNLLFFQPGRDRGWPV